METIDPDWQDWNKIADKQSIIKVIKRDQLAGIENVPNPRLSKERHLSKALNDKSVINVGDILRYWKQKIRKEGL